MDAIFFHVAKASPTEVRLKNFEVLTLEAIDDALREQGHPVDNPFRLLGTHEDLLYRYAGSTFIRQREATRDALIVVRSYQDTPTKT